MLQLFVPFLALLVTGIGLLWQHWLQPGSRRAWFLALGGGSLALSGALWWRAGIPLIASAGPNPALPDWQPALRLDAMAWPQAVALSAVLLGSLLTAISQPVFPAPRRWAGLFALTLAGYLALLSADLLTLAFLWMLLDLAESLVLLLSGQHPLHNESIVISLSARLSSVGLLLWASLQPAGSPSADLSLLLAAVLRLGVFPLHLPLESSAAQRQDVGAMLRIVAALSGFVIFTRVDFNAPSPALLSIFLLTALYSAFRWLQSSDALDGRPYWVIGLAALAGALALLENTVGVVALGIMLILGTAIFSLYALRKLRYTRFFLLISGLAFSSLPYSLTASIWRFATPPPRYFWLLALPAYVLLLIGYFRHLLRPSIVSLDHQARPIRRIYLLGVALLTLTALLLGLFGWPGARIVGRPLVGAVAAGLSLGGAYLIRRWRLLLRLKFRFSARRTTGWIFPLLWKLYRLPGRQINRLTAAYLEGPGGLLWVWLAFFVLLTYWMS